MGDLFYTVSEAAEILGLSEYTIREWLKNGKLAGKRVGKFWRIKKESVETHLPEK
ncbi:MAG: helix-turn-helix domain-containing protein [Synergistaceae bacterium]